MTERVIQYVEGQWPDIDTYLIFLRHLAAYYFAQSYVEGLQVLDLGCGTGYGSALLSPKVDKLVALDRSFSALREVQADRVLSRLVASSTHLPFPAASFDLVISFQVIEHIRDISTYLKEVSRVLVPGGKFIVSTPNKLLRLLPLEPPFNPYHVREYTPRELKNVLQTCFDLVDMYGLQASTEIMAIERKRLRNVNPIPYRRYLEKGFHTVLPHKIQSLVQNAKYRWGTKPAQSSHRKVSMSGLSEQNFSHLDFWVVKDGIKSSMDLIGICQKQS